LHGKGVGENDLLIIANAKRQGAVLVTNEAKQADLGKTKSKNYKIIYLKIFHQSAV
jgi:predicted nuclease of predicted toxin-antitoxin system